jgi:predicted anti-sigma-YlaC factor YlaD
MNPWHLDAAVAERYADGQMTPVLAASVEQHLITCADCRALLRTDPARLDRVWSEVIDRVHAPRPSVIERGLHRLGVDPSTARVISATPTLRGSWLTGVVLVLALALYVAHASPRGTFLFLVLAPVLPLLGVAGAFGPSLDPTYEIAAASPYSTMRMLVARTLFVVTTTLAPALAAAFFLPGDHWVAVGWLLPSLALTTVSLAAARHLPIHLSALALSAVWIGAGATRFVAHGADVDATMVQTLQWLSLAVIALAAWNIAAHRQDLSEQLRRNL